MRQNKFFMKKKNSTEKQFANIEEGLSKTEQFIEKNSRLLFSIIGLIIIILLSFYGYQYFWKNPLNQKAQNASFIAVQYFEKDSFEIALNGTETFDGFINILEKYSNTQHGELIKYYAGISYLNIGEYKKAIEMLEQYDSDDELLMSMASLAIGDSFAEINQPNEALEYYQEALDLNGNILTAPIILMKSANLYEKKGEYKNAIKCYQSIQNKYPESETAKSVDKYINNLKYRENKK